MGSTDNSIWIATVRARNAWAPRMTSRSKPCVSVFSSARLARLSAGMPRRDLVEPPYLDGLDRRRSPARSGAGSSDRIAARSGSLSDERPGDSITWITALSCVLPSAYGSTCHAGSVCRRAFSFERGSLATGSNETIGPVKPTSSRTLSWNWPKFAPTSTTTSTSYRAITARRCSSSGRSGRRHSGMSRCPRARSAELRTTQALQTDSSGSSQSDS